MFTPHPRSFEPSENSCDLLGPLSPRTPVRTSRAMAQVYSPTPHRIALCALARHLNYHPEDDDVELEGRARRDDGTRLLRARDRHALSRLLMEEATSTEGFREPALRAFQSRLDAFSRADGAPPAIPDDVVVDAYDVDYLSLAERDPDGRVNLKDLLRESLGAIRNVDDLVRLFRDVEPRSSHAVEMRGHVDDYFGDPPWPSPVDPDSIVGVFLRRCCVDFDRLSFEGACKVQSVFAHYVREGEGAFDHLKNDADGIRTRDLSDASRVALRADAAAGDADDAAAEAFASGGAPSHPFDPRGLADVGVRTPAALAAHVARKIHRAVSDVGRTAPGEIAAELDDVAPVAPKLPGAHLLRHLDALRAKDFPAAVEHLRRHFDTLAASDGADDPSAAATGVGPGAGAGAGAVAARAASGSGSGSGAGSNAAAGRARLQSALLALGVAHAEFAHGTEALKALNEAVRTAQQNGDESSLARAVAAFASLCGSSAGPLASAEGSPAGDRGLGLGTLDGTLVGGGAGAGVGARGGVGGFEAAEDLRLLLRRCLSQARALKQPHLVAFAELARARHRATRPPPVGVPTIGAMVGGGGGDGGGGHGGGGGGGWVPTAVPAGADAEDAATSASAASFSSVETSPPAAVAAAARTVETLRHVVALCAAAPPTAAAEASANAASASATAPVGSDVYPAPRDVAIGSASSSSATEASMRQLTGAASALAAAAWDAHGAPAMARVSALRHLRCDASEKTFASTSMSAASSKASSSFASAAAAADTASALASLVHHAAVEHGPAAASATLATASLRFPREDSDRLVAARARAAHRAATARGDARGARRAASALASLAPASPAVDPESTAEASRAEAEAYLIGGRLVDARDVAATQFVASQRAGTTHAALRATLALAETFLAAGAPASALPHALALEHSAAALRLDGLRAAAVVLVAECWLSLAGSGAAVGVVTGARGVSGAGSGSGAGSMSGSDSGSSSPAPPSSVSRGYAAMAKAALDAHMPALLGRGGAALRARARLAVAKAALATAETTEAILAHPEAIFAPLDAAADACRVAGAVALEAEAHHLRALTCHVIGDARGRDRAARAYRKCRRASNDAIREPGVGFAAAPRVPTLRAGG